MANAYGSWQNRGRIEWVYTIDAESSGQRLVRVTAYFAQQSGGWHQNYTGTKSWSGGWGSGSAAQTYNLSSGQRVQIVQGSQYVTLGDTARTASFTATANHFFGSSTSTLSVSVPARKPLAPSGLSVTRNSDTSHRLNWTRNSTYTGVVVQRRTNGGSWQQVSAPSGNLATWTDTTTVSNRQYQYRVAGKSAGGTSGFSNTVTVYTTPAAPSGVSAVRVGDDIRVSGSGLPSYATSYDVEDDGTTVATSVGLPWTHVAPSPAVTHRYRIRSKRGSLVSGWSAYSSTVQLAAPPNAATNLAPNGAVRPVDEDVTFSWRHNPVDASEQTAYELRWRVDGGAWTTLTGTTAETRTVAVPLGDVEWQVRTKGTHPDWGAWSSVATVTVIDRPGVAVIAPDGVWDRPIVVPEWTFFQEQGRPQSGWRVELLDEGMEVVESREGSGNQTSVALTRRVSDGGVFTVRVQAATGGVWSAWGETTFQAQFVPPAPAIGGGVWVEDTGAVDLTVTPDSGDPFPDVVNLFTNPRLVGDGTRVVVRRNYIKNPALAEGLGTWNPNASTSIDRVADGEGGWALRVTRTASSDPLAIAVFPTPPQGSRSVLVQVRGDGATKMGGALGLQENGGGYRLLSTFVPSGTIVPGSWTSYSLSEVGVSDAVSSVRINLRPGQTVGEYLDYRFVYVGAPGSYFDGSTLPDVTQPEDFQVEWTGAENASESILTGERVRGLTTTFFSAAIASSWNGKPAVRVIPTGPETSSRINVSIPAPARVGGTAVATLHLAGPLAGVLNSSARRILAVSPTFSSEPAPNESGSTPLRVHFDALTSNYVMQLFHGGSRGSGDVWWTDIGIFAGDYTGPAFSGDTGFIEVQDRVLVTKWDGTPDDSTSRAVVPVATDHFTIERSVDGEVWEPVLVSGDADPVSLSDWESLSNGTTYYRVTTFTADGVSSDSVFEVVADSDALWLGGGTGFAVTARLPYSPDVTVGSGRERTLKRYSGRERPVAYAGEGTSYTVDASGMIPEGETDVATVAAMERLAQEREPLHLYRDPDGRRIYGMLPQIALPRKQAGVWEWSFTLTQAT